jgi:hypothetical protein
MSAADRLLKLADPKTRIVPGHGPMAARDDLAAFRKMLATVHDRLAPMLGSGAEGVYVIGNARSPSEIGRRMPHFAPGWRRFLSSVSLIVSTS